MRWHRSTRLPASTWGWVGICSKAATEELGFVSIRNVSIGKTSQERCSRDPLPARTHLTLLAQQRPAIGVKLFPFLVKAFLF